MANISNQALAAQESHRAWNAMLYLLGSVGAGAAVPATQPTIMLQPGEIQHGGPFLMDCLVFCSMDVEYSHGYAVSGGLLFTAVGMAIGEAGAARARRDAMALGQPQWRAAGRMPAFLTSRRLLIMPEGQWKSYALDELVTMTAQLEAFGLDLHFEGENPVRVMGPWAPWMAVAISALRNRQAWPPFFVPAHLLPHVAALVAPQAKALTAKPEYPEPDQR